MKREKTKWKRYLLESIGKRLTGALVEALDSSPVDEVEEVSLIGSHIIRIQFYNIKFCLIAQKPCENERIEDRIWNLWNNKYSKLKQRARIFLWFTLRFLGKQTKERNLLKKKKKKRMKWLAWFLWIAVADSADMLDEVEFSRENLRERESERVAGRATEQTVVKS